MADGGGAVENGSRRDLAGELRDAGRVIREQLWLIALCALVGLLAGLAYTTAEEPEYQSTAKVLLLQADPNQALQPTLLYTDPARERATNIELVRSSPVAQAAADRLDSGESAGELLGKVNTSVQGDSNVLSIIATSDEQDETSAIANAFADSFIAFERQTQERQLQEALRLVNAQIPQLESGGTGTAAENAAELRRLRAQATNLKLLASVQTGNVQVVERAGGPGFETGSDAATGLLLGGLLGLLIGLAAAFLRDRLDPRVKSEAQVRDLLGDIPVVGRVPRMTRKAETHSAGLERFHLMRAELEAVGVSAGGGSLLITSAAPGEGKSSTAANLAVASSQRGEATILVEADVRNPELSRYTGVGAPGLADVLRGQAAVGSALHSAAFVESGKSKGPQIAATGMVPFMPAGTPGEDHWQLFKEDPLQAFLAQLAPYSSLVLVDGPPLGMFSDMAVLARLVDRVVVVVQMGQSRKRGLARLREQLDVAGLVPAGIVLLGASLETDDYRRYSS